MPIWRLWPYTGAWYGKHWEGPQQVEDKSPDNLRQMFHYLRSLPYQSQEDRERLELRAFIKVRKAELRTVKT